MKKSIRRAEVVKTSKFMLLLSYVLCVGCDFGASKSVSDLSRMTQETNAIIDEVGRPLDNLSAFLQSRENPKTARLVMIGENHVNEHGLKDSMRAVLFLAKKGDMVLLEGSDPIKNGQQDCDYMVFRIFALRKWNELGRPYEPIAFSTFQDSLFAAWYKAKSTFALPRLKLSELNCNFWDDRAAFSLSPLLESATKRNSSMALEIEKYIKQRRIFVVSGLRHLPMGDLMSFKDALRQDSATRALYNLSSEALDALKLEDFYKLLNKKSESKSEQLLRASNAFGATVKLDGLLKTVPSSELIPRYLVE
jgi:hypothetical protein